MMTTVHTSKRASNALVTLCACAAITALTLIVFWPVRTFEFQAYDDQAYVARNSAIRSGLSWQAIHWAFTTFHAANWHPLTWMSHMLDVQLFGLHAGAHHLTNLLLHTANSVLLLLVLRRMTGALRRSAFVAALFAVHPLHVESVAWIAERKDVLSAFFFFLSLWAYAGYVNKSKVRSPRSKVQGPKAEQREFASSACHPSSILHPLSSILSPLGRGFYWLSVSCFALGLLSKPMLVTLPFLLLLLDYWPLGRFSIEKQTPKLKDLGSLLLEKVPFFALAMASSLVTFLAQKNGGAVASLQMISLESRPANALAAYAGYLEKLIWPAKLAVLYLPPQQWPASDLVGTVVVLIALTLFFAWQARQRPYLIVGWLWFLGTLVPVIGLVQVGSQYMADRYSYLPFVGCFICVAWGGWDVIKTLVSAADHDPSPHPSPLGRGEGDASPASEISSTKQGSERPKPAGARVLSGAGALVVIVAAALLTRNQLEFWRTPESLFRHCLEVTTNNYIAYSNLGAILVNQHRYDEARPFYVEALRINPNFPDAVLNMGTLLALQGDLTNAIPYLEKAVQLTPGSAEAYGKLGLALAEQGRTQDAIRCYRESVRLKPDQVPAVNNLAWILATHPEAQLRNGPEAVTLAEHACQLTAYKEPMLLGTLAAAYAEAGRFSDATNMAEKAIGLATAAGQQELADKNRELVALYRAGIAYHEKDKR